MPETLLAFLAPPLPALRFALKTVCGGLLALWLALRLGLEQPQWALMTAFIVAQPLAGMVVQKALARVVGTLIGALMSLLLMAFAAQAPGLLLAALALWVGLCTGVSTLLRSAWSYAFVLSGYTAVLICLPALSEPLAVFDHAVARCAEIILGIVCATAVSAVVWPQHVSGLLLQQARGAWQGALNTAAAELGAPAQTRAGLPALLGQIVAVDTQREHAWFEGAEGRDRARAVRSLTRALLGLIRLARAAGRQRRDLTDEEAAQLSDAFEAVERRLQAPDADDSDALRAQLLARAQDAGQSPAAQYCLGRLVLLLDHLERSRQALLAVEGGGPVTPVAGRFSAHRDPAVTLIYGLRGALALLALAGFWFVTGWSGAVGAMILASVVCGLFASRENAVQIGFGFLRGILYALVPAFVVSQVLLPQWNGFPLLAIGLGVPLLFGALGMARPALMGTATSFSLHFIVLALPPAGFEHHVAYFVEQAIGMLIGVGCAVMAFRLIGLRDPRWHSRRLRRATLDDLAELCERRLAGADAWFAGRMTERLLQLARHSPFLSEPQRRRWDDGLFGLDIGDELLHLRLSLAAARPADHARQRQAFAALARAVRRGPGPDGATHLDEALKSLRQALAHTEPGPPQRLAHGALAQLERSWRQWCRQVGDVDGLA